MATNIGQKARTLEGEVADVRTVDRSAAAGAETQPCRAGHEWRTNGAVISISPNGAASAYQPSATGLSNNRISSSSGG